MRLGLPSESLIVSDDASGTFHDITSLLKQFESTLDFDSVMFVTSAYHSKPTQLQNSKRARDDGSGSDN